MKATIRWTSLKLKTAMRTRFRRVTGLEKRHRIRENISKNTHPIKDYYPYKELLKPQQYEKKKT